MAIQSIKDRYKSTRFCCYMCFIIQAIIVNFPPLLFLHFSTGYGIPLSKIALLVMINFTCQFTLDMLAAIFAKHINYKTMVVTANILSTVGLASYAFLPELLPDAYVGLIISTLISASGSGLIEVIANPIMQACPKPKKEFSMGFLHSFYCWGFLAVVLISTLILLVFGMASWKLLALSWAIVPAINTFLFIASPVNQPSAELEETSSLGKLAKTKNFWLFIFTMVLGGACELGMSQWASAFAELALVEIMPKESAKLFGDLLGPCFFALMMAFSRVIYPKVGEKYDLRKTMILSSILCTACYSVAAITQNPFVSLIGCGVCGFSVGIMWPGTLDLAGKTCTFVGTALFATLSLAGDIGCLIGPAIIGFTADIFGGDLKIGMTAAILLPIAHVIILLLFGAEKKNR